MRFEGIIPPVITPFHDDGSVDKAGYATVIEYMIESGVHAIIAGGTTGEFYALSPDERVGQFKHAKDIINGRVPLICGVNDLTTDGACTFAVAARDAAERTIALVTGLAPGTVQFAIKTWDDGPNISALSNTVAVEVH